MSEYTKGPWVRTTYKNDPNEGGAFGIRACGTLGNTPAGVFRLLSHPEDQSPIPDLIEALKCICAEVEGWLGAYGELLRPFTGNTNIAVMENRVDKAKAALAKAEGKQTV